MKKPTPAEKRFWQWLREQCCQVCGRWGVMIHHQPFKSRSGASHRRVVGLCRDCHQDSVTGVHGLGSPGLFDEMHGCDLQAIADQNWKEYEESNQ